MAYSLVISKLADADLDEIVSYLAVKLENKQAAADFLDSVQQKYTHIQEQPLMFSLSDNLRLRNLGYRKVVIGNYVMLYRVFEKNRKFLLRVFLWKTRLS
ncbi:MAG: type II toxin-antitoxin system RelE/ParE family toxin [Angelakisella sp.]